MADWISDLIASGGALGLGLLMFLENVFPPIPSAVIMPLAGTLAAEGRMSLPLAIAAALIGSLAGALLWYALARAIGEERLRRLADRHGRWVTLDGDDVAGLVRWFERHGRWAVPLAHVVPGLRSLISIPAGLFQMPLGRFLWLSTLGAGCWIVALALIGYTLGAGASGLLGIIETAGTILFALTAIYYAYRVVTFAPRKG